MRRSGAWENIAFGDCVVFDIKNNGARLISYISYEMGTEQQKFLPQIGR